MELDCSKLMLGGSCRDEWGTIGGPTLYHTYRQCDFVNENKNGVK